MESDRSAVLTVRAAVRGIIDYSEARLYDPNWWRRCQILLNGMSREDDMKLLEGVYQFQLALVSNSGLTDESFRKSQDRGRDAFNDIVGLLRPWEGKNAKERKSREVDSMRQAYINAFGDYRDPEWQARQDAALEAWLAGSAEEDAKESDWERIERLQIERAANLERLQKLHQQKPRRLTVKQGS